MKLAHSLYLSINYRDARGAARLGQRTSGKRGDGEEEEEEEEKEAARGRIHKVEDKKKPGERDIMVHNALLHCLALLHALPQHGTASAL